MTRDEYYEKNHKKEWETLRALLKKIKIGKYWIMSVNISDDIVSNGLRVTIFLRPRGNDNG